MTYDTMNPVPSTDPRDLDDNAQAFDRLLLSTAASEPDRLGVQRKTWHQMEEDAEALVSPNVSALAALTPAVDMGFFFNATSPVGMGSYTLSSFTRGLGPLTTQPAYRAAIGAIALSDTGAYAGSAAKLTTARDIAVTGDATWTVSFDGSANVTSALTLANSGVSAGTYNQVTVDAKGRVTAGGAGAFTALTLVNGWVNIISRRCVYRKVGDNVQIDFAANGGTATDGTTLTTLPVGHRPAIALSFPVVCGTNAAITGSVTVPFVLIGTDGTVKCFNCSGTSGLTFVVTIPTV